MLKKIQDLRQEYSSAPFNLEDADANPLVQFEVWLEDAIKAEMPEPNAMTLATINQEGSPSARVVLLKALEPEGFVFYSNYLSEKGLSMDKNANVALVFLWLGIQRQVRIEGVVSKVDLQTSKAYFRTRPRGSQIGAVASPQSTPIDRASLEKAFMELNQKYGPDDEIPMPNHWGGYLVRPQRIEFWQGRRSRLHDRINYMLDREGVWEKRRLAP
ncbi:MAG: pyridoxamine 5'-phosphate oxidase [Saprospiraceae bacterium]|jgi:pyridoxamine 5'-phosphate oxidase